MPRPFIWEMIKAAINDHNGMMKYEQIKSYINKRWENVNQETIDAQIAVLTVNHDSRIHYPENKKPRLTDGTSPYDILFRTARGEVTKYIQKKHGLWEISKNPFDNKLIVKQNALPIFTPSDIIWFKNVSNSDEGEAYLNSPDIFILNWPTHHRGNVLNPQIGDLILIYQKIDGIAGFSHLVTPLDNVLRIDENRPDYMYGRKVRTIAKTNRINFIRVSDTNWKDVTLSGITQGNACEIDNIRSVQNGDFYRFEIWEKFSPFFNADASQSLIVTDGILNEIDVSNVEISVMEGKLRLITHYMRERNRAIILQKKRIAIDNNNLHCEVCNFSFQKKFQVDFIECHHIQPISDTGERVTSLDDLALVCSNCHRMLHTKFDSKYLSIKELKMKMHL